MPDPQTGPTVQRIYNAHVASKGFQAIAKQLNQEITSPGTWGALRSGNPDRIARTATTTWPAGSVIDIADARLRRRLTRTTAAGTPARPRR